LKKFASKYEKHGLKISLAAQEKLFRYRWPGNIRELQHSIEKAVILSDSTVIKTEDFFFGQIISAKFGDDQFNIEEMEKRMILSAIERSAGKISIAAEKLGITRQTLYNKIKKFGL